MRKIAISLSKGGVGKTTTSVNLAHGLALASKRVLLIDTDVQGQAALLLGTEPNYTLADLIDGEPFTNVVVNSRDNLDLIAGGEALAGLSKTIARESFGGEQTLNNALSQFDQNYDYVIVDTAPGYDPLMINALFYVDEILCPISVHALSINGLAKFIEHVEKINQFKPNLQITYALPTFYDRRVSQSDAVLDKINAYFGDKTLPAIRYNATLAELVLFKQSIFELDPKSKGAEDYYALTKRILSDG